MVHFLAVLLHCITSSVLSIISNYIFQILNEKFKCQEPEPPFFAWSWSRLRDLRRPEPEPPKKKRRRNTGLKTYRYRYRVLSHIPVLWNCYFFVLLCFGSVFFLPRIRIRLFFLSLNPNRPKNPDPIRKNSVPDP